MARSTYLPDLAASASIARTRSTDVTRRERQAGLALSWVLFDFGARDATVNSARDLLVAANANLDSEIQAVRHAAVRAYYSVQAAEAALDAAIRSEQAFAESFKASEERYQVGIATPADKLQAQTALSQARLLRIQADGAHKTAQGVLASITGHAVRDTVELTRAMEVPVGDTFDQDIGVLLELAQERRPDLRAAEARWRASAGDVEAARASGLPVLRTAASTGRYWLDGDSWNHQYSAGLVLDIPLFSGFRDTYRIRAAEAQHDAATAARDQLRLQVAIDVWTAYQQLMTARQRLLSATDLVTSAERSGEVALGRYKNGVGSILDLLTAQSALASARQQRVAALHDWNVSRSALAFAIGNLDVELIERLSIAMDNKAVTR